MLRAYRIIPVYMLAMLPLNVCWGQQTPELQLMQIVRLYEQAQDSAFLPNPTVDRAILLQNLAVKTGQIRAELPANAEPQTLQLADYLYTAIQIYALTTRYQLSRKGRAEQRPLKALRPEVDAYTPDDFPLRFTVMGVSVVMRFENIVADLRLYYEAIGPLCSCRELRNLIPHLRDLRADFLAEHWSEVYLKKCRRL